MTAPYESFLEALECIPPELERNFTLMKNLDIRTSDIMQNIDHCVKKYKDSKTPKEREEIRRDTHKLFETLISFADDKTDISKQMYEAIDRTIVKLLNLVVLPPADKTQIPSGNLVGLRMPNIPNEPVFCHCRSVSHDIMIACEDPLCPIEWFHLACVNLTAPPKGDWYCSSCTAKRSAEKKKKKGGRKR